MARKPRVKTTSKDFGEEHIKKLIARMGKTPEGPHVEVGILSDAGEHDESPGVSVVQIAIWNEFGTDTIPERPFMRYSAEQLKPIMQKFKIKMLEGVVFKKLTLDNALDRMGLLAKAHIQKVIRDWKTPGNAPSTIYRKARKDGRKKIDSANAKGASQGLAALSEYDNPLVDTSQLVGSINYVKVLK